jgi:hypothetical protein
VRADRPDVAAAADRRFRLYATRAGGPASLELRYVDALADSAPPVGAGRLVYEVAGGSLRYHPESDLLRATVAGVEMRAEMSTGVVTVAGGSWAGARRHVAVHTLTTVALMERFERLGRFSLHAGCVGRGGRGIVIAGPTRAGKSTLVLALGLAGLDVLGDDMLFLHHDDGDVTALGFSDAVGVADATLGRLPELRDCAAAEPEPGFPKRLLRLEHALGREPVRACRPALIAFPEIVPEPVGQIEPLDRAEAWLRLVPDVLLTDAASTGAHLRAIAALTARVECVRLLSGRDVRASARMLIDRLGACPA